MTDSPKPWFASETPANDDARMEMPAVARNREAILAVLRAELAGDEHVLEVASGSGEHALYFTRAMPRLLWQPSDVDEKALASIAAWRDEANRSGQLTEGLRPPIALDSSEHVWWSDLVADAIFCANMTHIAPWSATEGLIEGAGRLLPEGGKLLLYGPFFREDEPPSEGDRNFDATLRARDERLGLRQVSAIEALAVSHGLTLQRRHTMPANNLTLVFVR